MTQPIADLVAGWKKATDEYISTWSQTFAQLQQVPGAEAAQQDALKTFLGAQAAFAEAARQVFGPMVEAAGGVPIAEFRRLMDDVHTVLLRLDRLDDAVAELRTPAGDAAVKAQRARKKRG